LILIINTVVPNSRDHWQVGYMKSTVQFLKGGTSAG